MISIKNNFDYCFVRGDLYVKGINLSKKRHNRNIWSIKEISSMESIRNYGDKLELIQWAESFKRTKKWLEENHPECLL